MANKFDGDVRPLSNDPRYMGVVFSGSMENALKQAKDAPDHGVVVTGTRLDFAGRPVPNRTRFALLQHLNLASMNTECTPPNRAPAPPSRYSLAAALARWPENFVGPS